jgi:tRNA threonylcarbamoyladenosine biosynthesis protein TsaB
VRILALDTATESCSAALLLDGRALAREQLLERGHAEHILGMIDELLAEAGVALTALDAIAFGRGPGAFTGVRLAASVTQGLAFAAGLAVVPVSDLRALAQRALAGEAGDPGASRVLACTDARMRQVYSGCYERAGALALAVAEERVGDPAAVTLPAAWSAPERIAAQAAEHRGDVTGVGSGFGAYPQLRAGLGSRLGRILAELRPRATEVAVLASAEVAAGRVFPPEQALPVYVRDEVVHAPRGESLN